MPITIKNNFIQGCKTAISTTPDVELIVDGNQLVNCQNGIVVRDPADAAKFFGVREELVRDALSRLAAHRHSDIREQREVIKASPFWDAVGKAADLTAVVPILLALL